MGQELTVLLLFFAGMDLIAFVAYGLDKRRAMAHRWRISERTLLLLAVPGGVGALLGILVFHHKTQKWKFRIPVPLFALAQIGLCVYLRYFL